MNWNNINLPGKNVYFKDDDVVIYCADCRDILPLIPDKSIDLVLTDPPYANLGSKTTIMPIGGVGKHYNVTKTVGDLWGANYDWVPLALPKVKLGMMIFCSYHSVCEVPQIVGSKPIALITWYKRNSPPSKQNVPRFTTEFVWAFRLETGLHWHNLDTHYDIPKLATGCMASKERFVDKDGAAIHPTQKPVSLMAELLKCTDTEHITLDPFLGTGTTVVACKKLNRKCIGIETEEKYCEIAKKRLSQSVMRLEI